MKKVPFKVSVRDARFIGREIVATSQGAATELVNDAFDKDAGACATFLLRRYTGVPKALSLQDFVSLSAALKEARRYCSDNDGTLELVEGLDDDDTVSLTKGLDELIDLWVVDNGNVMSPPTIEDSWMVIGTDSKEVGAKSDGGRILTGAKGIGRFALDRRRQKCEFYSAEENSREGDATDLPGR